MVTFKRKFDKKIGYFLIRITCVNKAELEFHHIFD
jgi:hypothetical protein